MGDEWVRVMPEMPHTYMPSTVYVEVCPSRGTMRYVEVLKMATRFGQEQQVGHDEVARRLRNRVAWGDRLHEEVR